MDTGSFSISFWVSFIVCVFQVICTVNLSCWIDWPKLIIISPSYLFNLLFLSWYWRVFFLISPSWRFIHFVFLCKELSQSAWFRCSNLHCRIVENTCKFWLEELVLISGSSTSLLSRTGPLMFLGLLSCETLVLYHGIVLLWDCNEKICHLRTI